MRIIWITCLFLMLSISCFADDASQIKDLCASIEAKMQAYIEAPTQDCFDELVPMAEKLMKLDATDVRGYVYLAQIYLNAGGHMMEKKNALLKALSVVDQYQNMEGKTVDLSSLNEILTFQIKELEDKEKMDRKTKRMLDDMNTPTSSVIISARALVRQYNEKANNRPDTALLDQAIGVLNGELVHNRSNPDLYLELSDIYKIKRDFANAYVMWRVAYQIGDHEDVAILNRTSNLYITVKEYERDTDVSETNPGRDVGMYFLWLNRESLVAALPPDHKLRLDDLVSTASERVKKLKEGEDQGE